ncbi:MAG TPA: acyl-ACP--UDP-N-acetylglucosamine O-acyltransferase [Phycisphaerae bacterium]|nr:acyl-ACP--UDP-N-acetylglucosamine O-acyltransferase [Phycisphaerae bacterium]HUU22559.1 acyl-ACP--UDP-N-acetylglucosamine O-acyltransferase [Phycisphaerae bacterium]
MAAKIHPTAIVDKTARLGDGVVIGPHVIVEPDVAIGDDCELRAGAVLCRYTTLGAGNVVGEYSVLGGAPQDYKFDAARRTELRIGSGNIIREYVTLSRATTPGGATVIGDNCYLMTQSHVGHDSIIGNRVILTNNVSIAGHAEVGDGAILSANTLIHQFCWVGEMVMTRGNSASTQHVPPCVTLKSFNVVCGLNNVGLRRAKHITPADHEQIKEAYRLLYRCGLTPAAALAEMDARDDWGPAAGTFRDFVRRVVAAEKPYKRGLAAHVNQQERP